MKRLASVCVVLVVLLLLAAGYLDLFALKLRIAKPAYESIAKSVLASPEAKSMSKSLWVRLPLVQAWSSADGEVVIARDGPHSYVLFATVSPTASDPSFWAGYAYSPDDSDPVNGAVLTDGQRIAPHWWAGTFSCKYLASASLSNKGIELTARR